MHFSLFRNIKFFSALYSNQKKVPLRPILEKWKMKFQSSNIESFDFDLKCMVAHILHTDFPSVKSEHLTNLQVTDDQLKTLERLCECRLARVPIQYILGEWDFYGLNLKMQPTVFIPRPETEGLVDLIIKKMNKEKPIKFLEVGSGTGAISLSILKNHPKSMAFAIDRSRMACTLTMDNAVALDLHDRLKVFHHIVSQDAFLPKEILSEKFDMIVSNPPYIKSEEMAQLPPEIKLYENLNSLDGGVDGLKIAKLIIQISNLHLKSQGKLWMELDTTHPKMIKDIISVIYPNNLDYIANYKDIYKKDRFVEIIKR